MKIVHTEASCGWGGQEIRILEEARGLIARGHEVSLLCPAEARIYAEAPRFGVPATALPIARKRLAGLFAMRRWLQAQRPDVVNTHSSTDSWLTALACASLSQAPAVVRTRHISAPVAATATSRWLYGRSAQHLVTTGESLRRMLIGDLALKPENVTSVPTGIDSARFFPGDKAAAKQALGLDPQGHYLGIVATLRSWKGHLYLLEAFAKLKAPDWTLLIVGEGPQRGNIEAKIAALNLQGRVILAGQQNAPEDWLRALDIFCLPSYANEGVPQALMQAMLSGLPIVTTPVGAILEAVSDGETALVVPPQDAAALAAAIDRLIGDKALAAELGERARAQAIANFSLEKMLDAMARIFLAVTQKSLVTQTLP
jgi:glycosyltransferase involved in cell wall biosynthesis